MPSSCSASPRPRTKKSTPANVHRTQHGGSANSKDYPYDSRFAGATNEEFAMRILVCILYLLGPVAVTVAAIATDSRWIVKSDQAYGCSTAQQAAQLHTMAVLAAALEIALAQRIEAGDCTRLTVGEVLKRLPDGPDPAPDIFRMQRTDNAIWHVNARFVAEAI
jgi:hypothetical protein